MFLWELAAQATLLLVSGDQTVVLSGQEATAALGSPTEIVVSFPTGQAATGQLGIVVVQVSKVPTGQSATGNLGAPTVVASSNVTLATQVATGAVGSVVATGAVIPTGQHATGNLGVPLTKVIVFPAGQAATGQLGSPTRVTGVLPSGQQATGQLGTAFDKITTLPSGVAGTGVVGAVTVDIPSVSTQDVILMIGASTSVTTPLFTGSIDVVVDLTDLGQGASGQLGSPTVSATGAADVLLMAGSATAIQTPSFFAGATITSVTGQSASGSVGLVTVITGAVVQVIPTGQEATTDASDQVVGIDVAIELDSLVATASVGNATTNAVQNIIQGLASQRAFGQLGTVTWSDLVGVTGRLATAQLGTVTVITNTLVNVSASGIQANATVGIPIVSVSRTVVSSSQLANSAIGTPLVKIDFRFNAIGLVATGDTGSFTLIVDCTKIISGVAATGIAASPPVGTLTQWFQPVGGFVASGQVGTVDIHADAKVFPTGLVAQAQLGVAQARPAVTVAVSGVAGTESVGTVVVKLNPTVVLAGQFATSAFGSVNVSANANVSVSPVGRQASAQLGAVVASASSTVIADDSSATGAVGSVIAVADAAPIVFGVPCTSQAGDLAVAIVELPTGLVAAAQVGSLGIQAGSSAAVQLPGQQATGQLGVLTVVVDTSRVLSGLSASGQVGSLGVTFTGGAGLAGVQATTALGAVALHTGWTVLPTGLSAQAQLGSAIFITGQRINPTGQQATGQVGTPLVIFNFPIQGVSAQGQLGIPAIFNDEFNTVIIQPIGFQVIGSVGILKAIDVVRLDGLYAVGDVGDVSLSITSASASTIGIISPDEATGQVGMVLVVIGGPVVPPFHTLPPPARREYECDPGDQSVNYDCDVVPPVVVTIAGVECSTIVNSVVVGVASDPCAVTIRERFEYSDISQVDPVWPEVIDTLGSISTWTINTATVKEGVKALQLTVIGSAGTGQESVRRHTFTTAQDGILPNWPYTLRLWVWLNEEFGANTGHDIRFGMRVSGYGETFVPTPPSGSSINDWTELTLNVISTALGTIPVEIGAFDSSASTHNRRAIFDDLRIDCTCRSVMDFTVEPDTGDINGLELDDSGVWDRMEEIDPDGQGLDPATKIAVVSGRAIQVGPNGYAHYLVTDAPCIGNDHYVEIVGKFAVLNHGTWISGLVRNSPHEEASYEVTLIDDSSIILWTSFNQAYLDLAFPSTPQLVIGQDYTLRVEVTGGTDPRIKVFLDGVLMIDYTDTFGWLGQKHLTGLPGLCIGREGSVSPLVKSFKTGPL